MPRGVYLKTNSPIARGSIVSVCLDSYHAKFGLERHYLMQGSRDCENITPLMKQVIAIPGDDVVLTDEYIQVNGKKYTYPTLYKDSTGRDLPVYPRGRYMNTNRYWLLGVSDPKSWDSRYWGSM